MGLSEVVERKWLLEDLLFERLVRVRVFRGGGGGTNDTCVHAKKERCM